MTRSTHLRLKTPTAYNFLKMVNLDLVAKARLQQDLNLDLPPLLDRADLIINERHVLTLLESMPDTAQQG